MNNLPTFGKLLFDFLSNGEDRTKYEKYLLSFDKSIHKEALDAPLDACLLFQGMNELFDKICDLKDESERLNPCTSEYIAVQESMKHLEDQAIAVSYALHFILYEHSINTANSDSDGYEMLEEWKYAGVDDSDDAFELGKAEMSQDQEKTTIKVIH